MSFFYDCHRYLEIKLYICITKHNKKQGNMKLMSEMES